MHTPSRPLLLLATAALVVAACGPAGSATPAGSLAARSPSTSSSPANPSGPSTHEPSTPQPSPTTRSATSQTDTPWGRIWDALPAGFPRFPGSTPADDAGGDPVTARFAVAGGNAKEIASWFQARLEAATFSSESLSGPLEDGSYVLESVGDGTCRLQVAIGPLGGMTFVTIRYGAACPNGTSCPGCHAPATTPRIGATSCCTHPSMLPSLDRRMRSICSLLGEARMQSTQPRELGILVLVVGLFLVLFVVTLLLGTPLR